MKAPTVVVLGLFLSGCATANHTLQPVAANMPGEPQAVICKKEKPTGSNRPVTVCRPAQGTLDRESTTRDMKVLQRQSDILSDPNRKK